MLQYFNQIKSIRKKLLIQFGLLISFSLILMVIMLFTIKNVTEYTNLRKTSMQLNNFTDKMRSAEKDFLISDVNKDEFHKTGTSPNIEKFRNLQEESFKRIETIGEFPSVEKLINMDSLKSAEKCLNNYSSKFHELVELYKQKGYKDYGLEGSLRKAIHVIEEGTEPYNKLHMLTLRRHEKDFFLRQDLKYVAKFDTTFAIFLTESRQTNASEKLLDNLNTYQSSFHQIVDLHKKLGTKETEGLKGELKASVEKMEPLIEGLMRSIAEKVENIIQRAYLIIISLFIVQLIIGVYLALTFSKQTTVGVQNINNSITKLSEGQFPEKIIPDSIDEIGTTSNALNNLIDRIRTASEFANKIGGGELEIQYDSNFNNDVLATALQNMHVKLKVADEENKRRSWTTIGMAKFAELLRQSDKTMDEIASIVISNLVKYLSANQGQLYIIEESADEKEFLRLSATYAWDREKFLKKTIGKGDGLVGQAWIEGETIYLSDVPKKYIEITSGLGGANPSNILIVPMKVNNEIYGVIEIASFKLLEPYKIEFVEKLGEVIASSLATHRINARTRLLLMESQQQAEELRAQEETVRQNQEEMMANQEVLIKVQEQMQKEKSELEAHIHYLENQLKLSDSSHAQMQN